MRISDWSSDVCSSDLHRRQRALARLHAVRRRHAVFGRRVVEIGEFVVEEIAIGDELAAEDAFDGRGHRDDIARRIDGHEMRRALFGDRGRGGARLRSEEHTSELQSLMRLSYAVFCLKKKTKK